MVGVGVYFHVRRLRILFEWRAGVGSSPQDVGQTANSKTIKTTYMHTAYMPYMHRTSQNTRQ